MSIYEMVKNHKEQHPRDEVLLNAASMASWVDGGEIAALELIKLVFGYDQEQAARLLETSQQRQQNLLWAYYYLKEKAERDAWLGGGQ